MGSIRIVVADDHPVVRGGLAQLIGLEPDLEIVGEAATGAEAVSATQRLTPRVVLMDLRMEGMDGLDAIRRIRGVCPEAEVIVLSNYDDDRYILEAVRAGAKGYLLKDVNPDRLVAAIRSVARGEAALDGDVMNRLVREFQQGGHGAHALGEELTSRELQVLQCLTEGLSNQEIAQRLVVSEKTVKSHLTSIYRKLDVRDRSQAILHAFREGLASTSPA